MKARSQLTSGRGAPASRNGDAGKNRMSSAERRAMILEKAAEFFSEYGLTAQTRALAEASGVAQRLLYRYFPSKADLLREVYDRSILAPFKAVWLAHLEDRSRPIEARLLSFYTDYYATVLTRRWLRLFLYASLGEADMAPNYIQSILRRLLSTIAHETAAEQEVTLPDDERAVQQIAWILHGSVSHLAIRQHIYGAGRDLSDNDLIALHVRTFVAGFAATAARARELEKTAAPATDAAFVVI